MAGHQDEITTTSSRFAYENRWMRVREDRIAFADGTPGLYGVVEKRDFVLVAARDGDRLHLVEQYRYPIRRRQWEFPQGLMESGETDHAACARRELREETGLDAASLVEAGELFLAAGFCTQPFRVFLATGLSPAAGVRDPEEQGMTTRAFAVAEFEAMLRDGTMRDSVSVAAFGLLRARGML
jgi:8-oxo-dGTP pyrophosphatase MutT (NUDIX family)